VLSGKDQYAAILDLDEGNNGEIRLRLYESLTIEMMT